ncbi:hypothetical protein F751_1368 [Auxenochlorella protothecoides]|uniref:Uncharacterized protein n=1 Tax=Auxenochlorella protothecoides TaxID=3075 RepID=A0A087SEE9_AUXPR|nr:hypothetical protein F751_1368 [Auxenochlorella protothecoides]KFM24103.1 hypothetical protein F751_1368 [Auxenochlorella protothecoides]
MGGPVSVRGCTRLRPRPRRWPSGWTECGSGWTGRCACPQSPPSGRPGWRGPPSGSRSGTGRASAGPSETR